MESARTAAPKPVVELEGPLLQGSEGAGSVSHPAQPAPVRLYSRRGSELSCLQALLLSEPVFPGREEFQRTQLTCSDILEFDRFSFLWGHYFGTVFRRFGFLPPCAATCSSGMRACHWGRFPGLPVTLLSRAGCGHVNRQTASGFYLGRSREVVPGETGMMLIACSGGSCRC